MKPVFAWTFPGGKPIDNYIATTLVNNVQNTRTITVPSGKTWLLKGGYIHNGDDVTRNISAVLFNSNNKILANLLYTTAAAAGTKFHIPHGYSLAAHSYELDGGAYPLVLKPGDYILITWAAGGASTGGAADSAFPVLEIDTP